MVGIRERMAWQSLAGMGPGGQNGGGNGNPEAAQPSNQPQGTEYTLQGMGFIRGVDGVGRY